MVVVLLGCLAIGYVVGYLCGRAQRPKPKLVKRTRQPSARPLKLEGNYPEPRSGWQALPGDEPPKLVPTPGRKKGLNAEDNALKRETEAEKRKRQTEERGLPFEP